jgi:hypothetical protein
MRTDDTDQEKRERKGRGDRETGKQGQVETSKNSLRIFHLLLLISVNL